MRPTSRPDSPYTLREIVDRVYQHFVVEENPYCVDNAGNCIYGRTGCGVGCLLTQEDADHCDTLAKDRSNGAPGNYYTVRGLEVEISKMFFAYFPPNVINTLELIQNFHDSQFKELSAFLTGLKESLDEAPS